jgi:hypothetical protein
MQVGSTRPAARPLLRAPKLSSMPVSRVILAPCYPDGREHHQRPSVRRRAMFGRIVDLDLTSMTNTCTSDSTRAHKKGYAVDLYVHIHTIATDESTDRQTNSQHCPSLLATQAHREIAQFGTYSPTNKHHTHDTSHALRSRTIMYSYHTPAPVPRPDTMPTRISLPAPPQLHAHPA